MSIIIEGFDKPKDCYSCPFNNSNCWCNLTKGNIDRDDWYCSVTCPIKELPKGHGRLIDVEEVIKIANKTEDLHGAIWNAPTIIEADKAESEEQIE